MRVIVEEEYDGFVILVEYSDSSIHRYRFDQDQEDSIKGLVDVFKVLGVEAEYREVY